MRPATGPAPESPRSRSSFTRNSTTREKNARAARSSRTATASGWGPASICASALASAALRAASSTAEAASGGSRSARRPSRRGSRSRASLSAKARRSASYCFGSSLDSPGLKLRSETPSRRARPRSFSSIVSDISSTGGGTGRPEDWRTTSSPPRKLVPVCDGRPEIHHEQERAALRGQAQHLAPRVARAPGDPHVEAGVGEAAPDDPAHLGLVVDEQHGGARVRGRGRAASGRAGQVFRRELLEGALEVGRGVVRRLLERLLDGLFTRRVSVAVNDASSEAVPSRRSSSSLRARSSISSSGLIPSASMSAERSRAPSRVGTASVRLNANSPFAQADEAFQDRADPLADPRLGPRGAGGGRQVPDVARHHAAVAEHHGRPLPPARGRSGGRSSGRTTRPGGSRAGADPRSIR